MKIRMMCSIAFMLALGIGCIGMGAPAVAQAAESPQGAQEASGQLAAQALSGNEDAARADLTAQASSKKPAKPSKKQLKAFKKASADFAIELFQRSVAAKGKNANVTIAPMSVMNALALTANGAKGKTARQLRKVLGDGASMKRINKNLAWYNSRLVKSKRARVNTANSIWYQNDGSLTMKKAFLAKANKYYKAEVQGVDFDDPATTEAINDWVAKQTNGMIKKVVDRLDPDNRIALINALYFDAKWKVPYESGSATKQKFTNAKGKKRTVQMLHGREGKYIEGDNVTGFIKPYAKGYSYVALLPAKGMSAKKYVQTLTGDTFRSLVTHASSETVITSLPKYSISYDNSSMEKQLQAMGITKAFSRSANFKGMAKDATGDLYIDSVIHKTKIDLDEEGTRAAAVTGAMMKANSALIEQPKVVTLDRPFVYAIVDNATKLPVFIGTVSNIGK